MPFLDTLVTLRKATTIFIVSVLMKHLFSVGRVFMKFDNELLSKMCPEDTSLIKISQSFRILYMKTNPHL